MMYFVVNEDASPCRVTWYHNEDELISSPKVLMQQNAGIEDSNEFKLTVKSLTLDDDGVWSVRVANDLGRVDSRCKITLKVPKNYRKPVFVEKLRANLRIATRRRLSTVRQSVHRRLHVRGQELHGRGQKHVGLNRRGPRKEAEKSHRNYRPIKQHRSQIWRQLPT